MTCTPLCIGSPPHTWRILLLWMQPEHLMRITSTHVENTISYPFRIISPMGSPPHTWRILHCINCLFDSTRITSTHVENTMKFTSYRPNDRDHLHTRGEYRTIFATACFESGSPPHTWRIHGIF